MILVVGGAGYLGSRVVDYLIQFKQDVAVYDNLLYLDEYRRNGIETFVFGDVTDHDVLLPWIKSADVVIWLAALVGDGICMLDPVRARAVNQDAVEFLAKNCEGKIIFTSTCSVYGHLDEVATEKSPLNPLSIYAETKVRAEEHLLQHANPVILRLGTLHGVSRRMRFDLVVNHMVRDAYCKGRVTVFGGEQKRPLLHVGNIARIITDIALLSPERTASGVFNLATQNWSVLEIASAVAARLEVPIDILNMPSEDRRDYSVDSSEAWGYLPVAYKSSVRRSIFEVSGLLKSGRLKDPFASRYSNQEAYKWNQR